MTLRALLVLLAVLNLGVAAWWLLRPEAAPDAIETAPSGIARLQLLSERPDRGAAPRTETNRTPAADDATAPDAAQTARTEAATVAERCFRLGPFADDAASNAAQAALRLNALRLRTRETREGDRRGWRVFLPAAADRAAADANAQRLKAAGFSDLLIVADGAEANSIALGRFSTEARAQQHAEALRTAGFAAQAAPVGEARTVRWIELAVAGDADIGTVRRVSGAARSSAVDCAGLR